MFASKRLIGIEGLEQQNARCGSPSPLKGERVGVRGGSVVGIRFKRQVNDAFTPHPQSLSPLRGEGSQPRALVDNFTLYSAIALTRD
jgi:hypothetical protein